MLNSMQFVGTGVVSALAMAFRDVAVPTDLLGVDRMAQSIAHFWWTQHDEELKARLRRDPPNATHSFLVIKCEGWVQTRGFGRRTYRPRPSTGGDPRPLQKWAKVARHLPIHHLPSSGLGHDGQRVCSASARQE